MFNPLGEGSPVYCNGKGISSFLNNFATAEVVSLCLITEGTLTTVKLLIQVSSHTSVPPAIAFDIEGNNFLVKVRSTPVSRQARVGQCPIGCHEEEAQG